MNHLTTPQIYLALSWEGLTFRFGPTELNQLTEMKVAQRSSMLSNSEEVTVCPVFLLNLPKVWSRCRHVQKELKSLNMTSCSQFCRCFLNCKERKFCHVLPYETLTHTQQFECVRPCVGNVHPPCKIHPLTSLSPLNPCETELISSPSWCNLLMLFPFPNRPSSKFTISRESTPCFLI